MLLKRLEIRNNRKIKQADIDFHGPGLQVIQGPNQSGKTTIAQSIALTMEGPKAFTPGMITSGQEQAEIIAYTDDGIQIRTVIKDTAKDAVKQTVSRLEETSGKYIAVSGGVRTFLDSIRSGLEMPWSMKELADARVIEILKDRAGISGKITQIDAALKDKEMARTEVGRDKKKLGTLNPVEKIKHPDPIDEIRAEHERATKYVQKVKVILEQAGIFIKERCNFTAIEQVSGVHAVVDEAVSRVQKHLEDEKKVYTIEDIKALDGELAAWVEIETKAKAYDDYFEKKKEFDNLTVAYDTLTAEIEGLRADRKRTLAEMNLGVKGLEIGEDNMLYHNGNLRGITDTNRIGNWSTAESVGVFFSIGARFSGELRVIAVDNAESLDDATTKVISNWADTHQFLVILLKVASLPEELEDDVIYVKEGEVITA
ncbi:hypothetical protein FACS189447_09500 [Spirochaetia bacterium]|nr:hypothetical protein FACS189447_09500 [Spirochaetia bacterium]